MATFEVVITRYIGGSEAREDEKKIEITADHVAVEVEENVSPTLVFYGTNEDAIDGDDEEVVMAAFHEWDYVIRK